MAAPRWPSPRAKYDDDAADEAAQLRWQHAFEDAFAAQTLRLESTGSPHIRILRGSCPRCGHELNGIDVYGSIIRGVNEVRSGIAITNIVCNCERSHAGRPAAKSGCGWAPHLNVTFIWPTDREPT